MSHVHIIGAGLAGLSCAMRLTRAGVPVTVYEAAPHAGGRCRSYYDPKLEHTVDNGNHFLLSANNEALDYLTLLGARNRISTPPGAYFPFLDLETGERWTLRPAGGPIPWWIFAPGRRVGGSRPGHYLNALRLLRARSEASVTEVLYRPGDPLWSRLWHPLTVAILNTEPEAASAALLRRVMLMTIARGAGHSTPMTATASLSDTFVDPALDMLAEAGTPIHFGERVRALKGARNRLTSLDFGKAEVKLGPEDTVVLAVTAPVAKQLLPRLTAPTETRPIVNVHIRLPHKARLAEGIPYLGLTGGTAEWLFLRQDIASITVSAARTLMERPAGEIAQIVWEDTARALSLDPRLRPPIRVIKERRATIAQSPEMLTQRPPAQTSVSNLILAGSWTDTGLPSTIEGAIASGHTAARLAQRRMR